MGSPTPPVPGSSTLRNRSRVNKTRPPRQDTTRAFRNRKAESEFTSRKQRPQNSQSRRLGRGYGSSPPTNSEVSRLREGALPGDPGKSRYLWEEAAGEARAPLAPHRLTCPRGLTAARKRADPAARPPASGPGGSALTRLRGAASPRGGRGAERTRASSFPAGPPGAGASSLTRHGGRLLPQGARGRRGELAVRPCSGLGAGSRLRGGWHREGAAG